MSARTANESASPQSRVPCLVRPLRMSAGGINSDGTFLNLLYRYEPAAQLWSLLGPNGITTTNSSSSNSTSADTPNTVLWPPGRASAVAFTVGDSTAFVGFGVDPTGKELADLWSFTFHTPDCAPSYPDPTSPARPCLDSQWQRVGVSSTFDANKHPRPPTAQFVTVSPAVADGVAVFVDQRNWLLVFGGTGQSSTTANNSYYLCEMKLNTATPSVCTWFLVPLPGDSPLINPLVGASAVLLWPYVLITGGAVWELVNLYVLRLNLLTFQWDGLAPQRIGAGAAADAATRILTQSWVPIRPLIDGVAIEYANGAFFHGGYTTGGVGQDGVWDRNSLVAELFFLGANASCPDGFNASTVSASLSGLADCTPCSAGTFSARGWCFPCPAGTYRSSSNATCLNCPAGTYGSFAGAQQATDCTPCAAGTMQNRTGQSTCDACPPDDSCLMLSSSPLNSAQWNQFFPKLGVVPVAGAALPAAEGTGGVDSQAALIVGIIIAIVAFALIIAYGRKQQSQGAECKVGQRRAHAALYAWVCVCSVFRCFRLSPVVFYIRRRISKGVVSLQWRSRQSPVQRILGAEDAGAGTTRNGEGGHCHRSSHKHGSDSTQGNQWKDGRPRVLCSRSCVFLLPV